MKLPDKNKRKQVEDQQNALLLLEDTKQRYKDSFYSFFKDAVHQLEPATIWEFDGFHELLCELLQAEALRVQQNQPKDKDLIINCPPRVSKSMIVSVCFNAWVWAFVNPFASFVTVSHTEDLAVKLAFKTRKLIESNWYKALLLVKDDNGNLTPMFELRADSASKGNFENTLGGIRTAYSATGGITGDGGHFLLIDDIHKPQDIGTKTFSEAIETYKTTIYTRVNSPKIALRLVIGQRLAENDLSGVLMKENPDAYKVIQLPYEFTDGVPLEFHKYYSSTGLLTQRLESPDALKRSMGVRNYESQYNQNPTREEGELIKSSWFESVDSIPNDGVVSLFIDTAEGIDKKKNDASTILVTKYNVGTLYVIDLIEVWLPFPDLCKLIASTGASYPDCRIYIEPKSNGRAVVQTLRQITQLNLIELPTPKDSKVKRVEAASPAMESRRVKLYNSSTYAVWYDKFKYQINNFPHIKQDGIIDVLAYSVATMLSGTWQISMPYSLN